jgi:threonine dehydratase
MTVRLEDIQAAAKTIQAYVKTTPCVHSRTLSNLSQAEVWLKFENLQFTASFKERGALNKLLSLSESERRQGVITMSAGNHAQAVAYHSRQLGIPAVIVMPRYTPNIKVEHTRAYGAEVILAGECFDDAAAHALKLAEERKLVLVHPYDDEKIIAGQGTIALEMLRSQPDMDTLIIPVGGGGLISGIALAAKSIKDNIRIIGVETERFPAMINVIEGKKPKFGLCTLAEGIAVKQPGQLTVPVVKQYVDEILLVDEESIEQAVLLLLEIEKTVAEGAGAAGLAALLKNKEEFAGKTVGLVISGGNIDMPVLARIIQRGLVRTLRLCRIKVEVRDIPGTLAKLTACIEKTGTNIHHVHHHRLFTRQAIENVTVEFVLQTRGKEHVGEILSALKKEGYFAQLQEGYQS